MAKFRTICSKTLDQWVEIYETQPSSFMQTLTAIGVSPAAAVLIAMEILRRDPGLSGVSLMRKLMNIYDLAEQHCLESSTLNCVPATEEDIKGPVVSSGKIVLQVSMNDTIELRAKNDDAQQRLNRCGKWWVITQARVNPDMWFLRSHTRQKQGMPILKNHTFENMWIAKVDDPNFEITRVCPNPKEFDYKEYK